jgi:hypothetical protein
VVIDEEWSALCFPQAEINKTLKHNFKVTEEGGNKNRSKIDTSGMRSIFLCTTAYTCLQNCVCLITKMFACKQICLLCVYIYVFL